MALWFNLQVNAERLGRVEIRRRDLLDLSDQAGIQDEVSTYDVFRDGGHLGTVDHRYGDKAWVLLAKATALIAQGAA